MGIPMRPAAGCSGSSSCSPRCSCRSCSAPERRRRRSAARARSPPTWPTGRAAASSSRSSAAPPSTCRRTGRPRCRSSSARNYEDDEDGVLHRGRSTPGAAGHRRRPGRSTARPTASCTSTSSSCSSSSSSWSARPTDLAEQYIVAHEYGHHVQNVLGTNAEVQQASAAAIRRARTSTRWRSSCRPTATPGRGSATSRAGGVLESAGEIDEALDAAAGVGDDRIQQQDAGPHRPGERGRTAPPSSARRGSAAASTPATRAAARRSTRCSEPRRSTCQSPPNLRYHRSSGPCPTNRCHHAASDDREHPEHHGERRARCPDRSGRSMPAPSTSARNTSTWST